MELTNGGNGGDDLSKLELVENGGLTSSIESHHKYTHLLLRKQPAEQLREWQTHLQLFWKYIPDSDFSKRNISSFLP